MIIYPAIDLRRGRCVRLRQGRADQETVFSDDPLAVAQHWVSEGAAWLHIVDLDAAMDEGPANATVVQDIVRVAGVPVQFGGGLRSAEAIEAAFARGVRRVVIGTAAVSNAALVRQAIDRFGGDAVAVGIDSKAGKVAVRGWQETSEIDGVSLALQMNSLGVERIVFTDVSRDGMLEGPNLDALHKIAAESGLQVIASGGIARLTDLTALAAIPGIDGAIIGQALYTGAFRLRDALAAVTGNAHAGRTSPDGRSPDY
jgi:phosphoribosylformimino-5-aminoimidazole carboxamide ribotide isomerase